MIKKLLIAAATVAASFTPMLASANGADVVHDTACQVTLPGYGTLTTTDTNSVITPSGNVNFICNFTHEFDLEKAIKINDAPCATLGGFATTAHKVFTPGGTAKLVCQIK